MILTADTAMFFGLFLGSAVIYWTIGLPYPLPWIDDWRIRKIMESASRFGRLSIEYSSSNHYWCGYIELHDGGEGFGRGFISSVGHSSALLAARGVYKEAKTIEASRKYSTEDSV